MISFRFGPMLIGTFVNMILYGILVVQAYHYYLTFRKDAPWIKYLVLYLFILETINTGCDMAMMFQPLITEFGTPTLTALPRRKVLPDMCVYCVYITLKRLVAVSTPIQIFFAWRIKLLTKSNILALFIVTLSLVSLVGGSWTTAKIVEIKLFSRKPELHLPALVWFLSACVCDVLITVVLVFTLSKRKTGFVATDDAISKIIRMTVQTGMLTAFFAVGDVVFFMSEHFNFLWDLSLSKLYANCLLSTLNARLSLQEHSGYHNSHQRQAISSSGGPRRPV
ncbi:hypothetical protein BDZ97DRAFT_1665838 [Flammula alnicola]|nr:hypothetical protein BDZ97DRAFT_1665838 [Flammula alnicola]